MSFAIVILTLAWPVRSWGRQAQAAQPLGASPQQAGRASLSPKITSQLSSNIVALVVKDASGKRTTIEHGFFVDPWTIVTSYPPFKEATDNGAQELSILRGNTKTYIANYFTVDRDHRLLFIDVQDRGPQSLPLGKTDKINPKNKVYLFPGIPAAESQASESAGLIEMAIPLPSGYSGLPTLDQSGKVIGVAVDPRFKSAPASGVIPVKELASKLEAYFGAGKEAKNEPTRKSADVDPSSNKATDSPTAEREAGGQMALQPGEAGRTTAEDGLNRFNPLVRPKVLKRVRATYMRAALDARVSGSVVVNLTIDEQGEITQAKVVSGHELLKLSALRAARKCLFAPALQGGLPVKMKINLEFTFSVY